MTVRFDIMYDMDDFVYPFVRTFHTWMETVYPKPVPFTNEWEIHTAMGISEDSWHDHLTQYANSGGYNADVAPLINVWPLVDLWERGHRLHVVTARPDTPRAVEDGKAWLRRFGVPFDTFTTSHDKAAFLDYVSSEVAFGVDDAPKNVKRLRERGVRGYLYNAHHNRFATELDNVRVGSAEEFRLKVLEAADAYGDV